MDHCSKFMYFYNQVKCSFESTLRSLGFTVLNYHGDNGIFASQAFKDDCHTKGKQISFSCAGAHHHNGIAERSIQTVIGWARTMLSMLPYIGKHLELISGSRNPDYSHL